MPINIPDTLPARKILEEENIFVMTQDRAMHQDVRPLQILLLNLMPTKIETETQFARLLGNTPLQVTLTLMTTGSYQPKNTPGEHMTTFYKTWDEIKDRRFDGLVVTGAPVEHLAWENVAYWQELTKILDWSNENVFARMFFCWSAQAALHHWYGIEKHQLPTKYSGIFLHHVTRPHIQLFRGFDEEFPVPVSRHTMVRQADIENIDDLEILALSSETGVHCVQSRSQRDIFIFNHPEYDVHTLQKEFERDKAKDAAALLPRNYFPEDDPTNAPQHAWRAHAHLFFSNWINYVVYQQTPYDLKNITPHVRG